MRTSTYRSSSSGLPSALDRRGRHAPSASAERCSGERRTPSLDRSYAHPPRTTDHALRVFGGHPCAGLAVTGRPRSHYPRTRQPRQSDELGSAVRTCSRQDHASERGGERACSLCDRAIERERRAAPNTDRRRTTALARRRGPPSASESRNCASLRGPPSRPSM